MGNDWRILDISSDDDYSSDDDEELILEPFQSFLFRDEFVWIMVEFVVVLLQIVAAVVVLTLAKDEQQHQEQMYFRLIISYTVGCIIALPILCLRFFHHHTNVAFTIRIHKVIDKLKKLLEYFFVGWVVVIIWDLINNSSSPDPPTTHQFWLCMAFLAISCVLHVLPNFPCAVFCFVYPMLLRLIQSIDFFDDITDKVDLLNWEIAGWCGVCICIICCIVSCCRCS